MDQEPGILTYTAFEGFEILAQGVLEEIAVKVKRRLKTHSTSQILIFSDTTGKQMDLDLSGSEKEVLARLKVFISPEETSASPAAAGPGRPKLGVVAREVSLLPRHWEWLSTQSGGASATLRRLVDEARKKTMSKESIKQSQERVFKLMSSIAGNLPNYEEALRALFRRDRKLFHTNTKEWPSDLKAYLERMAEPVFEAD